MLWILFIHGLSTVFPHFSSGSQMSAWSRMSKGSKVIVFQMSTQKKSLK